MSKTNNHKKITIADMAPHVHSFAYGENKVDKITSWLVDWITNSLASKKISQYDMLPTKGELAYHIGVSQGTMQNVFRKLEDMGYVESKQKVGTYISVGEKLQNDEKLTSKRDMIGEKIKLLIKKEEYMPGDKIPSTRRLAVMLNSSPATIRSAITSLISEQILKKKDNGFVIQNNNFSLKMTETKTLVEKVANNLRIYINKNLSAGDKIPTNDNLAIQFNVSTKTIHDAIKLLIKEGILYSRRGQYGTVVLGESSANVETYSYEKVGYKIKRYIIENCKIQDKLPTIRQFAKKYQTSEKTVKHALDDMMEDGYIMFIRGRYGGTFVTDIPEEVNEAYRWLAINAEYIPDMEN